VSRYVVVVIATAMFARPVFADEGRESDKENPLLMWAASVGVSYPLIASVGGSVLLPLAKQNTKELFPSVPSLRTDIDVGLGGGSVSAGVYIPAGGSFAINLKGSRMRTWLWTWNEQKNRTYDGAVAEVAVLGHVPGKIGLGYFKDRDNSRNRFTYVFLGVGF
jgi:hypothetical protein